MILPLWLALSQNPTNGFGPELNANIVKTLPKKDEEKWLSIPWRTHLIKARAEAQKAGKPIYLWIMVGNPQGCT